MNILHGLSGVTIVFLLILGLLWFLLPFYVVGIYKSNKRSEQLLSDFLKRFHN